VPRMKNKRTLPTHLGSQETYDTLNGLHFD
jgi:hypothetical protein